MDAAETSKAKIVSLIQDMEKSWDDELLQMVQSLPKEEAWVSGLSLYLYQGFWCSPLVIKPIISFQTHFPTFDSDVIIATFPKCGTTWLKALAFSTLYRNHFAMDEHPLLTFTPHQLVRFLEIDVYLKNPCPDLENICVYKPRVFATHVPYASLPTSMKDSHCKIVYICRNPMDMFISLWLFNDKLRQERELLSVDEAFEKFCHGICGFGPFFDHVLGYWKASQENPNKILFLKYEDIKEDISSRLKQLAMFLGVPFTEDEEKQGVVEEIAKICSFEKLKELEVNKKGTHVTGIPHKEFFRKGEVGDWSNYLTPSMVERLEKLIHEKMDNSGLTFKLSSKT
ncbi:Polyribonucleotide nucleotidyltransferase isoform 1 [Hibiscus syriacus]|uniref:Sulfotransferase n=1 Tax=Hibiscus syriacus TaxID=106335 RepID=A0A6A3B5X3_HIBSY|nr:cytosolic sulfotransferase 15-like [Hibiscus syriacus]KAE8712340.1 Polyribonucleotide nucleotidyltransferase isoform 1 [Hibiscus syriacus]